MGRTRAGGGGRSAPSGWPGAVGAPPGMASRRRAASRPSSPRGLPKGVERDAPERGLGVTRSLFADGVFPSPIPLSPSSPLILAPASSLLPFYLAPFPPLFPAPSRPSSVSVFPRSLPQGARTGEMIQSDRPWSGRVLPRPVWSGERGPDRRSGSRASPASDGSSVWTGPPLPSLSPEGTITLVVSPHPMQSAVLVSFGGRGPDRGGVQVLWEREPTDPDFRFQGGWISLTTRGDVTRGIRSRLFGQTITGS